MFLYRICLRAAALLVVVVCQALPPVDSAQDIERDVLLAQFMIGLRKVDTNSDGRVSIKGYTIEPSVYTGDSDSDELFTLFSHVRALVWR